MSSDQDQDQGQQGSNVDRTKERGFAVMPRGQDEELNEQGELTSGQPSQELQGQDREQNLNQQGSSDMDRSKMNST